MRVRPGIVGEHASDDDPVLGEEGERSLEEADDRKRALVCVDLAVGEPRVVVDDGMHEVVADGARMEAVVRVRSPVMRWPGLRKRA